MKSKSRIIFVVSSIIILAIIAGFVFIYLNKNKKEVKNFTVEEKKKIYEEIKKNMEKPKKYVGKAGDTTPPEITDIHLTNDTVDFKNLQFPELLMNVKDESGIFRVRVYIKYDEETMAYMQENLNTKSPDKDVGFRINEYVIFDGKRDLKDYEGAEFKIKVAVWDNNMNMSELELKETLKVVDNTPPEKVRVYWTYYYESETSEIEVYNNNPKNIFTIYRTEDMPKIKENSVEKYEIKIEDFEKKVLYEGEIKQFEDSKKDLEVELGAEGKFVFFLKALDKNNNFTETKVKFYLDFTPPDMSPVFLNDVEVRGNDELIIKINAKDELSGVAKYRIGATEKEVWAAQWEEYNDIVKTIAQMKTGINQIWIQLEDNALNHTQPIALNYATAQKAGIEIKTSVGDRERVINLEKDPYKKGGLKIKEIDEK